MNRHIPAHEVEERAHGRTAPSRRREVVWHLTLTSSADVLQRFFVEVETHYARALLAAWKREDEERLHALEQSCVRLVEAFASGDRLPWRLSHSAEDRSDTPPATPIRGERRVDVTLRGEANGDTVLLRFGSSCDELHALRTRIESAAPHPGVEILDLLRDSTLGLMALPGANDVAHLTEAWAADARAILVVAFTATGRRRCRVVPLHEGSNTVTMFPAGLGP